MIVTTVAFISGVLLLQYQPTLPASYLSLLIWPLLYGAWRYRANPVIRFTTLLPCGFLWAAMMAHITLHPGLPTELEGRDLRVVGVVESLPDVNRQRTRFRFQIEELSDGQHNYPSPGTVRLNWYRHAPALSPGERWQLSVRLKRPHGMANPGTMDYEKNLFQQGIRATGYVRDTGVNRKLDTLYGGYLFQRLRQNIAGRIDGALQPAQAPGLVRALAIGDHSAITPDQWTIFRETGTNHLVAISGLHIGIVSGLAFFLGKWLWRRSVLLCTRVPATQAGAGGALLGGFVYAGLAGFAIPCVRALVMLAVVMGGLFLRRVPHPSRSLCVALMLMVALDPASVLSMGFWLSFGAVAAIMFGVVGRSASTPSALSALFRVQWVVSLGLAPLLLMFGLELPLLSPLVNLVMVPLFSLLVVPFTLVSTLLLMLWPSLGTGMLEAAGWLLGHAELLLAVAAEYGESLRLHGDPPLWMLFGMLLSVLLFLLPAGLPGRWLGTLLVCPLLFYRPAQPPPGEVWMTMLDVGQGLAIVLETSEHVLLYDTGPMFPSGFNTGDAVVVPFLRSRGVRQIDQLIVTNGDRDHRGGLAAVLEWFPDTPLLTGEPERVTVGMPRQCTAGMHWEWDGVQFEILHPDGATRWQGNNASCVLAVRTAGGQLLFTGDIEAAAEEFLVQTYGAQLMATAVTIPHHGSATSSGAHFMAATTPDFGLVSSGYRNRYGFPKAEVTRRWREQGARLMSTAAAGAISLRLGPDGLIAAPAGYRMTQRRYWMDSYL